RAFTRESARLRRAVASVVDAGWSAGIELTVFEGPDEYLYGEETGLLEAIDGRPPFPRVAPPFRRGVDEIVDHADLINGPENSAAGVELAGPGGETLAPPALVSNVETFSHAALILAHGADWFRALGTPDSPGTIVCTVTGSVAR